MGAQNSENCVDFILIDTSLLEIQFIKDETSCGAQERFVTHFLFYVYTLYWQSHKDNVKLHVNTMGYN